MPSICYTHPEVASVGITEDEAKKQGLSIKVGKFSMMANSRARAVDDAEGVVSAGCEGVEAMSSCHGLSLSVILTFRLVTPLVRLRGPRGVYMWAALGCFAIRALSCTHCTAVYLYFCR